MRCFICFGRCVILSIPQIMQVGYLISQGRICEDCLRRSRNLLNTWTHRHSGKRMVEWHYGKTAVYLLWTSLRSGTSFSMDTWLMMVWTSGTLLDGQHSDCLLLQNPMRYSRQTDYTTRSGVHFRKRSWRRLGKSIRHLQPHQSGQEMS